MKDYAKVVEDLVSYPTEEEWFEFKENWFEPRALGEYVSALSNAASMTGHFSGYFIWGVSDRTHAVVGTSFRWYRDVEGEPLEHWLARKVTPSVAFSFHESVVRDKRVVVMEVPAAKTVPTAFDGERFIRIGSSKERVSRYPEREAQLFHVLSHGLPTIDNTESLYQDLGFSRLFTYYAGRGIALREETFRENLGLTTSDGRYNVLAQLLADETRVPVRVSVFRGTTKASPLYSVREFGNTCLLVALDRVLEYGEVVNVMQADERGRTTVRTDVPLFDPDAYREAVINAFAHNSWVGLNAPMVTVFSDRIEILSHGQMAPGQTMEGFFRGTSVPVNRSLSDIFLQLHVSERSGRGVPKIVERYGRGVYEFGASWISVTLPFERVVTDAPPSVERDVGQLQEASLSPVRARIIALMRDNPNITQKRMSEKLGLGHTAVADNISWLRDNGYVVREGSRKAGWWRVL